MWSIKKEVKEREKCFKEIRKNIREESKCSWEEATDCACMAFEATYGTYDSFYKTNIDNVDKLVKKIKMEYTEYVKTIKEFFNREYQLLSDVPTLSLIIFNKNKIKTINIDDSQNSLDKAIVELNEVLNNKKIKEVYYGEKYSYGIWCYPEWSGFEVYLV